MHGAITVLEGREAAKRAQEAAKQSDSMKALTFLAIAYLPLTCTAVSRAVGFRYYLPSADYLTWSVDLQYVSASRRSHSTVVVCGFHRITASDSNTGYQSIAAIDSFVEIT